MVYRKEKPDHEYFYLQIIYPNNGPNPVYITFFVGPNKAFVYLRIFYVWVLWRQIDDNSLEVKVHEHHF